MSISELKRVKELEVEHSKLERMYAVSSALFTIIHIFSNIDNQLIFPTFIVRINI